jgi:hypothetical protein
LGNYFPLDIDIFRPISSATDWETCLTVSERGRGVGKTAARLTEFDRQSVGEKLAGHRQAIAVTITFWEDANAD